MAALEYKLTDPPTCKNLQNCLRYLVKWQPFALCLPGIEQFDIDIIECNHKNDVDCQKRVFFDKWLRKVTNPSWKDVITSLKENDENKIASEIQARITPISLETTNEKQQVVQAHEKEKIEVAEKVVYKLEERSLKTAICTEIHQKEGKSFLKCPTCCHDHHLPQGGVTDLPKDLKINSLLDLQKKMVTNQTTHTETKCSKHDDLLKVFCETCSKVICRDCTISQQHNTHEFYLISECYTRHNQQILASLDLLKHRAADLNIAVTHLDIAEREVLQQGQHLKEQINTHAQQLIQQIQTSQKHLSQQVDTIVQQKTQVLSTQKQQAQKLHTQLNTCQQMIEHSLKEWTQQQILTNKNSMMVEMNTATQHVEPTVFQPLEKPNIKFNHIIFENKIGLITSTTYKKAILEASPCQVNTQSTATLTLQSHDESCFSLPISLISSRLSSPANKHSVKCDITQTHQGKYNITFTPSTRHDQLIVQVGGVDIPDSPFTLPVSFPPEMRRKLITGLNKPNGKAVCDNGDVIVAETLGHCISKRNKEGKKVEPFGPKERWFTNPRGVAISIDGHVLVTDDHRLQKFKIDGAFVDSVGSENSGSGQLKFNSPSDLTVHPTTGEIFVADKDNNRIQVFKNDLTFSYTIELSGQFNHPVDVALDDEGYLYVAEWDNHRITKLTMEGMYIGTFGSRGSGHGQLHRPSSLAINNNLVYICEWGNNRVSIFDTNGKFIDCFGEKGDFKRLCSIRIDTFGNLYISDQFNNRIVVYMH